MVFTGYTRRQHKELLQQYKQSLAPATWSNKAVHLAKLTQFCDQHKLNVFGLEEYDVLSYLVFLKSNLKSPGAVLNYFSSARTWCLSVAGSAQQFDTYNVSVMKKGLTRVMGHVPSPVPALQPDQLKHMVAVLDDLGPSALPAKALLLIGYFSALRQSNLIGQHALLTEDVTCTRYKLTLLIRKSKTIISQARRVTLVIPCIPGSSCCPVRAWRQYVHKVKPSLKGPALVLQHHFRMSIASVTKLLRLSLAGSSYENPVKFTLHALRRGAVHGCVKAGASKAQLMDLGQWSSSSVATYLPPRIVKGAFSTLTASFG